MCAVIIGGFCACSSSLRVYRKQLGMVIKTWGGGGGEQEMRKCMETEKGVEMS